MKKLYCTQNEGDCSTCSLINYGRDCRNNLILHDGALCTNAEPTTEVCIACKLIECKYHEEAIEKAIENGATVQQVADMFSTEKEKTEADTLTKKLSVFKSFQDLLDAEGGYRPSMNAVHNKDCRRLADLYDAAQKTRGDSRRASRY